MKLKFSKCIKVLSIFPAGIFIFLSIDMLIFSSIYHPLTYFYSLVSWGICQNCNSNEGSSSVNAIPSRKTVVTSQDQATKVGLQILEKGGNSIDAAVAVGFALSVVDPCCGNIGGGGFALYRTGKGVTTFINFREQAPLNAYPEMYQDKNGKVKPGVSTKGYRSVAVPGTVAGLDYMLNKYGTMPRSALMEPAINLAKKGFVLGDGDVKILRTGIGKFKEQPNVASIFLKNRIYEYQVGDWLVQENLADTLKSISRNGPQEFYAGRIAKEIVAASQKNNGILTLDDFKSYVVEETEPVTCRYREYDVITAPPPGGGITLCQMLNILEGYNLKDLGFHSSSALHLMLSSMMFAYADRNIYLGDPRFVKIPANKLLSKAYAKLLREKIIKNKVPKFVSINTKSHESVNTTHYSVYDKYGNSVSVTYTINGYFGSGSIAGNTGFFLNNEMDDFAIAKNTPNSFGLIQGDANRIEPKKRPLSSMSPTIVLKDNKPFILTGSPGGSTIPTTVLQVLINLIDYKMNINSAVNSPRVHYQGSPNIVISEPFALNSKVFQELWEMGFKVIPFPRWGAANSIEVSSEEKATPAFDFRKPAANSNSKSQ